MTYINLWKRVPRSLGFIFPNFFISLIGFVLIVVSVSVGGGLAIIYIGLLVVAFGLYASRAYGAQDMLRLRAAGMPKIIPPRWQNERGFSGWVKSTFLGVDYWRAFGYVCASFVLGIFTWSLTLLWTICTVVLPLGLSTYWIPQSNGLGDLLSPYFGASPVMIDIGIYGLMTVIFGGTLPFVLFGFMQAHQWLAQHLLSRRESDVLRQRVRDMSAAEGRTLRSLERDIHDGPQQQLLRLQMDISTARRRLSDDPEAADLLLSEAQDRSAEILAELRRLSKGIAPPLLMDRGLVAAVKALSERNVVPTRVEADENLMVPSPIDQSAYFVISELFTNVMKHSSARAIIIEIREEDGNLRIRVSDDGKGGAAISKGGGLAGIEERIKAFGGTMVIYSPEGGPTSVNVVLPLG